MHTLSNDLLSIDISSLGAELQSIRSAGSEFEFLWQGNPDVWSGRAPILFPIVGALKDGQFEFEGKTYTLPQHGLARTAEFTLRDSTINSALFELSSNDNTQAVFPWEFTLQISYTLKDNHLVIEYRVENTDDRSLRFTIGSHPAFRLTDPVDHYHIRFSHTESLQRFHLTDEGLLEEAGASYSLDNGAIALTNTLFDDDALVFKNINSNRLTLCRNDEEIIRIHTGSAPHLGLWAKPAAPYVCIEPWFGHSDSTEATGSWLDKPAMLTLEPTGVFNHRWMIELPSVGG